MITPLQRSILFGLAFLAALTFLTSLSISKHANLSMADYLFTLIPNPQPTPPILLISTTESDRNTVGFLQSLIEKLNVDSPKHVYLLGHYSMLARTQEHRADWMKNITVVDSITRLKHHPNEKIEYQNLAYMSGVTLLAGHFRYWQNQQTIADTPYTAFQAVLSHKNTDTNTATKNTQVQMLPSAIIDFSMEDGLLPLVKAQRVLNEGLASGLVTNKYVLIGEILEPGNPGFTVPIRPHNGISQLEIQGYALHSALNSRFLHFSGYLSTLAGVMLIAVLSTLLFQWFPPQFSTIYSITVCLLIVALQWLSIKYYAVILPAWEWLLTQIISMIAVYQLRRSKEEHTLNRIIAETNNRLADRVQPLNFNRTNEPWKKILSLVNQQLNIKRSIFLEKLANDHRIQEIDALDCSIDDISEYRRDYQRPPYSDALEVNAAIVPFRDYFKEVETGEVQYLIPLTFAGEVLGFWALTLIPEEHFDQPIFEDNLNSFSVQISELLYHRNQWKLHSKKVHNPWIKLINLDIGQSLHKQLTHSVTLLENRLDTLEDVFNGLSTAAIVYDVFGQVLHTNSMIEQLAQSNDMPIYKLTALELLAKSADICLDHARKKLRYVTLKNQTITFSSRAFSDKNSHLLLIRPLHTQKKVKHDQIHPFQILGILFEFIDISPIQQQMDIRRDIANKYFHLLRNNLATVGLANRQQLYKQEKRNTKPVNSTTDWPTIINKKVAELGNLTDQIEVELRHKNSMGEGKVFPINTPPFIKRIVAEAEEAAYQKELTFNCNTPELTTLCYMEPLLFEELIKSILNLLISDAVHKTLISIIMLSKTKNDSSTLEISLDNMGHGVPKEQLEKSLATTHHYTNNKDDPLTQVIILANKVKAWGGRFDIQTNIGSGFSVKVELKGFSFKPMKKDIGCELEK